MQGFRKIDTDKWEFANEGFVRGQRHLLKNIQRRKSPHPQHVGTSSDEAAGRGELGGEVERLRKERNSMMQEVIELQNQQRGTVKHMEMVNEKLQTAEKRQKQMVSFLGKIFQTPTFLTRFQQSRQPNSITSPRTMRKFVKHQADESGTSGSSPKGQIYPFKPQELSYPPMQDTRNSPFEVQDVSLSEYAVMDEFLGGSEHGDPVVKGKEVAGPENLIPFPDTNIPELSMSGMAIEDELWGNVDVPELEFGGLSDDWNVGGSSGIDTWLNEDSPFSELDKRPRDDSSSN